MAIQAIIISIVKYLSFKIARENLEYNEPIPDFSTRYSGSLENCLMIPFQEYASFSPYPTLISKASILLYLMIKNHPFLNGNKRIAMTTLLVW